MTPPQRGCAWKTGLRKDSGSFNALPLSFAFYMLLL